MAITSEIRQRGFAKWYERELMRGHAHLVLVLLALLGALGAVEAFGRPGASKATMGLALLAAAAVVLWAVRRYLFHLGRAELLAHQASCPDCGTYARWQIETIERSSPDVAAVAGEEDSAAIRVACRRCSGRWRIEW